MAVIGIDLGCLTAVMATTSRGTITTITNQVSERATAALVGYGKEQRLYGGDAHVLIKSNVMNTVQGMRSVLGHGVAGDASVLAEAQQWALGHWRAGGDSKSELGQIFYEVMDGGAKVNVSAAQVCAALLARLHDVARIALGKPVSEYVLTYPDWFSYRQRVGLLLAAQLVSGTCLKIVPESQAVALDYGIFRSRSLKEKVVTAFFMLGHSTCTLSVCEFGSDAMRPLCVVSSPRVGGRVLDRVIVEMAVEHFERQHGFALVDTAALHGAADAPPRDRAAARRLIKLEEAARKAKKILSANAEAPFLLECIHEEQDLSFTVTREEFEARGRAAVEPALRDLVQRCLAEAGGVAPTSVEAVGGTTRVPWIAQMVTELVGLPLSKTLNLDETTARGAALHAAMKSDQIRVVPYACAGRVWGSCYVAWAPLGAEPVVDASPAGSTGAADAPFSESAAPAGSFDAFPRGSTLGTVKKLRLPSAPGYEVALAVRDPGREVERVQRWTVTVPEAQRGFAVNLFLALDDNGLFGLTMATTTLPGEVAAALKLSENKQHLKSGVIDVGFYRSAIGVPLPAEVPEPAPPAPEPVESEAPEDATPTPPADVTKRVRVRLPMTNLDEAVLTARRALLKDWRAAEQAWQTRDGQVAARMEALNRLESAYFETSSELSNMSGAPAPVEVEPGLAVPAEGAVWHYCTEAETQAARAALTAAQAHLDAPGTTEELAAHAQALAAPRAAGAERRAARTAWVSALRALLRDAADAARWADDATEATSHIEADEREPVRERARQLAAQGREWAAALAAANPADPAPASLSELERQLSELQKHARNVMGRPKPAPVEEPPAEPEPAAPVEPTVEEPTEGTEA